MQAGRSDKMCEYLLLLKKMTDQGVSINLFKELKQKTE